MMRSLRLLPTRRPSSNNCISTGEFTDTHPETGTPCGADSGTTSDAVAPAWIVTCSVTELSAFCRPTTCVPGEPFDQQRRDATALTVDGHGRSRRIGADVQLSFRRGDGRQLDELRDLPALRDLHGNGARLIAQRQLELVVAGRKFERERRHPASCRR